VLRRRRLQRTEGWTTRTKDRDFQAEGLCEEMIEIARDTSGDNPARARLRMNALERQAAGWHRENTASGAEGAKGADSGPQQPGSWGT
jgi:hypothetical protein